MSKSSQLEVWSRYQQLDVLTDTYNSVKNVLSEFEISENHHYLDPYLQGSYANDTSIYGKGDIDVVVELESTFRSNLTDEAKHRAGFVTATYQFDDFNRELFEFLVKSYGSDYVKQGNKTIKLAGSEFRRPVDIVCCLQYRHYLDINDHKSKCLYGISIKGEIINYPVIHKENGKIKMQRTDKYFKKYVRIFKNLKKKLEIEFPSYFIECLLYNVPNELFDADLCNGFEQITDFLLDDSVDYGKFISQNGIVTLFGDSNTQWNSDVARNFISECRKEYEKL